MKIPVRLRWSDLKVMTMTPPLRLPGWVDDPLRAWRCDCRVRSRHCRARPIAL